MCVNKERYIPIWRKKKKIIQSVAKSIKDNFIMVERFFEYKMFLFRKTKGTF